MTLIHADLLAIVVERAGSVCEYCYLPQDTQVATFPVDHIVPIALDGLTQADNLALACPRCNALKWMHTQAIDVLTGDTVDLFHPRRHLWSDHFCFAQADPTTIEGLTPTGRATIARLDLNALLRRRVRQWLMVVGRHPPE